MVESVGENLCAQILAGSRVKGLGYVQVWIVAKKQSQVGWFLENLHKIQSPLIASMLNFIKRYITSLGQTCCLCSRHGL